jgi:hypothetical protein
MVWDIRTALLKKQEVESSRLSDFEFRLRARTMRRLAPLAGASEDDLVAATVLESDEAILKRLSGADVVSPDVQKLYDRCRAEARRELIEELGDPSPHRLA